MPPKSTVDPPKKNNSKDTNKDVKKEEKPADPFTTNTTIVPKKPTIVYQKRHPIYNRAGDEPLSAVVITFLVKIESVEIMHWSNATSAEKEHSQSYTTGFKTTARAEQETSSTKTETITVIVPAKSSVWLYQRKYVFRTETIFVLDAWGSEWNVASNNGDRVERLVVTSEIMAKDYVTSDKALKGKGEAEFTGLKEKKLVAGKRKAFDDTTSDCQDVLRKLGIDGV